MKKTVTGLFLSRVDAETALRSARATGLNTEDVSILERSTSTYDFNHLNDPVTDGVMLSAMFDGGGALVSGIGSGEVDGLGAVSAHGPAAIEVNGTASFPEIIGKLGIPQGSARQYLTELKSGKILWSMTVDAPQAANLARTLKTSGAVNVSVH